MARPPLTHAAWPVMMKKRYGRVIAQTSGIVGGSVGHRKRFQLLRGKRRASSRLAKIALHTKERSTISSSTFWHQAQKRVPQTLCSMRAWRGLGVQSSSRQLQCILPARACHHNGMVMAAGARHFARVEAVQSIGKRFDVSGEVSVEDLVAHLDEIDNMRDAHIRKHGLDGL